MILNFYERVRDYLEKVREYIEKDRAYLEKGLRVVYEKIQGFILKWS